MSHAEEVIGRSAAATAPAPTATRTPKTVMQWGDLLGTAIGAIKAHPMRSSLTALGVVIGVASVVAMTSIGLGAQKQVESAISNLGSNLLMINSGAFRGGGVNLGAGTRVSITDKDAEALKAALTDAVAVTTSSNARAQLIWEGHELQHANPGRRLCRLSRSARLANWIGTLFRRSGNPHGCKGRRRRRHGRARIVWRRRSDRPAHARRRNAAHRRRRACAQRSKRHAGHGRRS